MLSRDQILQAPDIKTAVVNIPEWGGDITIRALSLAQSQEWRKSIRTKTTSRDTAGKLITDYLVDPDKLAKSDAALCVIACVDESGNRIFADSDIDGLMQKSPSPVTRLALAIVTLSGLKEDAADEAEKNSEPNPSA